jgi:hypothetical protein
MVMEPSPAPSLKVIETKLLLEFLVVPVNPPSEFGQIHHPFEVNRFGKVGHPVLGWLLLSFGPLDEEPLFRGKLSPVVVSVGLPDPKSCKAGGEFLMGALSPGDNLPVRVGNLSSQIQNRHGRMLRVEAKKPSSPAGMLSRRQGSFPLDPHLRILLDTEHVLELKVSHSFSELTLTAIARIREDHPPGNIALLEFPELIEGYLGFGLELDFSWDTGLFSPLLITYPVLIEMEPVGYRKARMMVGYGDGDSHLAVVLLTQLTTILSGYPHGVLSLLRDAGVIDYPGEDGLLGLHLREDISLYG